MMFFNALDTNLKSILRIFLKMDTPIALNLQSGKNIEISADPFFNTS